MKLFEKIISEISQNIGGDMDYSSKEKWICIKRNGISLSIEFDDKGNHIEEIGIFQDVTQVVNQKKIF